LSQRYKTTPTNMEHDSLHTTNCWQETKKKMWDLKSGHKNWLVSYSKMECRRK